MSRKYLLVATLLTIGSAFVASLAALFVAKVVGWL